MNLRRKNISSLRSIRFTKKQFTLTLVASFVVFYILLTIQTVSSGSRLSSLEKESESLTRSNRELTAELVKATSLTKLSEGSVDLGFVKPDKTVYLSHDVTAARLP